MLSEITQTGLRLEVLDFGFVCDEPVRHILRNRFGTQTRTFGTQYLLVCTYRTNYILPGIDCLENSDARILGGA